MSFGVMEKRQLCDQRTHSRFHKARGDWCATAGEGGQRREGAAGPEEVEKQWDQRLGSWLPVPTLRFADALAWGKSPDFTGD